MFTFCIKCMLHKTTRVYSCIHSATTYLSNYIHSIKDGKHGVELERSDYKTFEIGEGKCHSAPLTHPGPDC